MNDFPGTTEHETVDGVAAAVAGLQLEGAAVVGEARAAGSAGKRKEDRNAAARGAIMPFLEIRCRPKHLGRLAAMCGAKAETVEAPFRRNRGRGSRARVAKHDGWRLHDGTWWTERRRRARARGRKSLPDGYDKGAEKCDGAERRQLWLVSY